MKKKIDIFHIANEANVSIATVSRVINNSASVKYSTKKKVLKIIKKYQFYPNVNAKRLAQKKTNNIGIVFPYNEHVFLDWYMTQLLDDLQSVINKYKYDFSIYFPKSDKDFSILKFFEEGRVDGMIIGGVKFDDFQIEKIYKSHYKFILLGSYAENVDSNYIDVHNEKIVRDGIQYLYKKGHRKIGAALDDIQFSAGRDRANAFIEEMKEEKLKIKRNYLISYQSNQDIVLENILDLLDSEDRPTAIFAMSDLMAFEIYKAASVLKMKIPDELSVLSIDDTIWSQTFLSPSLTTYQIPTNILAEVAVSNLIYLMINSQFSVPPIFIDAKFIERNSVKNIYVEEE